jgi:hypothetical protein
VSVQAQRLDGGLNIMKSVAPLMLAVTSISSMSLSIDSEEEKWRGGRDLNPRPPA